MCGIVGQLGNLPTKQKCIKARDTMQHRGPDDGGIYYNLKEDIFLGHRRLAIIDLSVSGRQPMVSNDGRLIVIFNGEIYNYLELKKELKDFYNFKTKTDTEILLAAYIKWGEAFLKNIRGMFSFAIWDRKKQQLLVVRDRLGIKPLYYACYGDTFYFASEMKAILKLSQIQCQLDQQGFLDYLSYRHPLGSRTMFRNIFSLLPGHYFIYKKNSPVKIIKYWDLDVIADKKDPGEEEVLSETAKRLKETIHLHMISDVPLGAYLSGGLDSSILVALMAEISNKPIKTFSIGFARDGFNEFQYSREIARKFNTNHHEYFLHSQNYFDLMPELIRFKDAPLSTHNEVALYVLSKQLKRNITVVLSGDGADELFAGYGRIFRSGYDFERMRLLDDLMFFSADERAAIINNMKIKYKTARFSSALEHFLAQYPYLKLDKKISLLNKARISGSENKLLNKSYFKKIFSKISALSPTDQYLYIFQKIHLLGPLHRLDNSTMAASVEARVPYIDHKFIEYVSALPEKYKLSWASKEDQKRAAFLNSDQISEKHDITKYILRKIGAKYLPSHIIKRKKMNFPAPLNYWLGTEYKNFAKEMLLSPQSKSSSLYNENTLKNWINNKDANGENKYGLNIWMLLNIEIWMREYKVEL